MKRGIILALFFLVPNFLNATLSEEYLAEIQKMKSFFEKEKISMTIDYSVYSQSNNKLLDSKTGYFEKSLENYYYSLDGILIIQNDKWNVYLSEIDKVIAVKEMEQKSNAVSMSFDQATVGCESIAREQIENYYIYTLKFKEPVSSIYSSVKIYAKKSDFEPFKIVFDYAQKSTQTESDGTIINDKLRLIINYRDVSSHLNHSYSTNDFFKEENGSFKTVGKYIDYQLIDQRKSQFK